jgi:hypothetical protein
MNHFYYYYYSNKKIYYKTKFFHFPIKKLQNFFLFYFTGFKRYHTFNYLLFHYIIYIFFFILSLFEFLDIFSKISHFFFFYKHGHFF